MHVPNRVLNVAMRRLIVALGVLTVVGLIAGATFAFAGSTGTPGVAAYALVVGTSGTPQLIADHTSGFIGVSVGPFGQGDYCLTPAPGVNVVSTAAVASIEAFYSNAAGWVTIRYPTSGPSCGANQLEVKVFNSDVTALTNQVAFTVNVP
jgi:hypothetical protein